MLGRVHRRCRSVVSSAVRRAASTTRWRIAQAIAAMAITASAASVPIRRDVATAVSIGANTVRRQPGCVVGADCRIDQTFAERAEIGDGSRIGPFAFIGQGTSIAPGTTTGAFYTAGGPDT